MRATAQERAAIWAKVEELVNLSMKARTVRLIATDSDDDDHARRIEDKVVAAERELLELLGMNQVHAPNAITHVLWSCPLCARSQWLDADSDEEPVCVMCDEAMKVIDMKMDQDVPVLDDATEQVEARD